MQSLDKPRRRAALHVLAVLLILLGGVALTWWRINQVDQRIRDDLLRRATLVSWALRADLVDSLAGDKQDRDTLPYQRIQRQLESARQLYADCRFLYLCRMRADGKIIFLVDAEPEDSDDHSPPGQVYDEASEIFYRVQRSGVAATEGPIQDRWGTWISAIVPLFHPVDDRLVAMLGMDIDASKWRHQLIRPALVPIAFTAAFLIVVLLSNRRIARRQRGSPRRPRPVWRCPEVHLALAVGLILTLLGIYLVRDGERERRRALFMHKAVLQTSLLQQFLSRIGDNYLESVARYFMSSEFVDRSEFSRFVGHLVNRPYARRWGWVPVVRDEDRARFVEAVRNGGAPDFEIWEFGPGGTRVAGTQRPLYYPYCYLEPEERSAGMLGGDHGTVPHLVEAMRRAAESNLPEASDPIQDPVRTNERNIVLYRAVITGEPPTLHGFTTLVLHPETLLFRALSRESTKSEAITDADLYQVDPNGLFVHLASNRGNDRRAHPATYTTDLLREEPDLLLAPVFAFGKTYALASRPGSGFSDWYPALTTRRVTIVGLLLTGLLTALVATLTNRRTALEQMVNERTAKLLESEASYHGLFNSMRHAIFIQDREGRFLGANDGAVAMFGYSREELTGQTPVLFDPGERNDMAAAFRAIREASEGEVRHFEFWGRRKDGAILPCEVWLNKGAYFGQSAVIAVVSDISDRKKSEQEHEKLQSQLQQAQKMESIGRLAGGVAHDFNNMLQAILGNTMLALEEVTTGPQSEYLQEIKRSAERSADLTRQLLAFASRQPVSPRVIDLNDTIAGTLKMLRRLIGEDIRLQWVPGTDLEPVLMDPTQLDQILANLAVNARDAMNGGGVITIETAHLPVTDAAARAAHPDAPAVDIALISFRDNGKGMDEETRIHIFEPFFTTKEAGKGTGLGLATVFGIVKQNNGFIDVKSAPGAGTVFTIGIPCAAAGRPHETEPGIGAHAGGGTETILVVEDEQAVLQFVAQSLRKLGYTVLATTRPEEAITLLRDHAGPVHALITDVVLPGINGRELAQTVTSIHPGVRCIFMSGYTADIIATRGILDAEVNFIQKPFRAPDLATLLRAVLDTPPGV
ncbi:MAG TPA: CHASE domain-containing protein [Kiritimatiellia bacterium]|nr:CHASE domain-containing protein [Kiritimatiellia bacterium]